MDDFIHVLIIFSNQYKVMLLQMVGSKLLVCTRSYSLVESCGFKLGNERENIQNKFVLSKTSHAKLCEIMLCAKPMLCQSLSWGVYCPL
jgi:hypothetical protein